jgi:hypothetical protein
MHRQHGRTFSAWTDHSSGSPITDDGSDIHITITKAKPKGTSIRQSPRDEREEEVSSPRAASRVELKYQPPTASDFRFHKQQAAHS